MSENDAETAELLVDLGDELSPAEAAEAAKRAAEAAKRAAEQDAQYLREELAEIVAAGGERAQTLERYERSRSSVDLSLVTGKTFPEKEASRLRLTREARTRERAVVRYREMRHQLAGMGGYLSQFLPDEEDEQPVESSDESPPWPTGESDGSQAA
jgi:hypothetical protein